MPRDYHYNKPYTAEQKLEALILLKTNPIALVSQQYHCSERTLYRWRRKYNGTIQSLKNGSPKPLTPNPKTMPDWEKEKLIEIVTENPNISDRELSRMLGTNRNPAALYRKREKIFGKRKILNKSDYRTIFNESDVESINVNDSINGTIPNEFFVIEVIDGLFLRENEAKYPVCLTPYLSVALKFETEQGCTDMLKSILCDYMRWIPRVRRVKSGKPI